MKRKPDVLTRFRSFVNANGGSARAAFLLGCTRQAVDYIYAGKSAPGLRIAVSIEHLAGIAPREWVAIKTEMIERIK